MGMIRFLPGTVIAKRFFIEEAAGQGGMGTVYRSRDLQSGNQVAVKLMHTHCDSEAHARRFTREAELLAELRHPAIVAYLDHGHTYDGWPFLAMEWLQGEELGQHLRRRRLTLSESLTLLRDVAQALAIAHRRGIVHRKFATQIMSINHIVRRRGEQVRKSKEPPPIRENDVLTAGYSSPRGRAPCRRIGRHDRASARARVRARID